MKRHRAPTVTALLVMLAVIAGAATATAVVFAILFGSKLDGQVHRLDGVVGRLDGVVHSTIPNQRRGAIETLCESTEAVKRDARRVFRRFGITRADLPAGRDGRHPFDPVVGGCHARARKLAPTTSSSRSSSSRATATP